MTHTTKNCTSKQRCGNWRICTHCAAIRQKKAADKAQALEQWAGPLFLSVITPEENTGTAIRRARAALLRKSIAKAGIWSIEIGEKHSRLHLNIITPQPKEIIIQHAAIHTERITTTARNVAAYITKQSAAPSTMQYDGRLLGTWGSAGEWLSAPQTTPVIQAASVNDLLKTPDHRQPYHFSYCPEANPNYRPELTKSEYKTIAESHLVELYETLHQCRTAKANNMQQIGSRPRFG